MTDSAIIPAVDPFGSPIPQPNEAFINRVIHPRNLALEARRESARILSRKEFLALNKEAERLFNYLEAGGWYAMKSKYKLLKGKYNLLRAELEVIEDEDERAEKLAALNDVIEQAMEIKPRYDSLVNKARRHSEILEIIKQHNLAVEREHLHNQLTKELAKEAYRFAEIIIEKWSQLGFRHEYQHRNKRYVHKVQFDRIEVMPDAIWLKVLVTQKAMFGFKSALPQGVKAYDLIDEKTLRELSIACQRQVTGKATYNNGVWVCVNRLGTTDGLLNYVQLKQLLNNYPADQHEYMPLPIGVGEGREITWIMLAHHPHFLVAGSTGNGKSNITNAIICSLIRHHSPKELRLVFIDLKEGGAEFADYSGIPHALMPTVTTVEDAVNALAKLDALRSNRMHEIARGGCKNIMEYNERYPDKRLPRILIIVDEYARIKARGREFAQVADRAVGEITALGRAAGVHLYAATQTPYSEILPGTTKGNMAMRLAFALPSAENSKSVIGNGDAFKLPQDVKGRAIIAVGSKHWQVQTPHCKQEDIEEAIKIAMEYEQPETPITLPDTVHIDVFDENELLDIAINELNGNLGAQPIYDFVKGSQTVTLSEVREIVKRIKERKVIEFEGEVYRVVPSRKGHRLQIDKTGKNEPMPA